MWPRPDCTDREYTALTALSLETALIALPQDRDPQYAIEAQRLLLESSADSDNADLKAWVKASSNNKSFLEFLGFIFAHSPFLTQCALSDIEFLCNILEDGPDTCLTRLFVRMKDELPYVRDQDRLMSELRIVRRKVALLTGIADISGHWPLDRVTQALSDFADGALSAAISHLLLEAADAGEIALTDPIFPEDQCGYVALAMGKHGGRELNYSSDIDLIVLYEPSLLSYHGRRSHQQFAVRLTQRLVTIMQQPTADGYVCRMDLNLRPDPSATPAAVGYAAAQTYYRNRGENWERAAMIKARPAAGDLGLGRQFLDDLAPFVWREAMDFWMLQDMLAIKRRINAHKGGDQIEVVGQNVKLGRGGIREIEFYAQTQQLIYGGADPYLRCERTVEALTTLAEAGHIEDAVADELTEAYEFLRKLEHRLQMVDDRQTQTMPITDDGVERIAQFMGFDDVDDFRSTLLDTLFQVANHYGQLFEGLAEDQIETSWSFQPEVPDTQTLASIEALGFSSVSKTYERLKRWYCGAFRISRNQKTHKLLQMRIPDFARSAAHLPQPNKALEELEKFLTGLPSGLRLFSMISAHPSLLGLLLEIVTLAPYLAETLARRSDLMQAALSPRFLGLLPDRRLLSAECAEIRRTNKDTEDTIDQIGKWVNEHRFQVSANLLRQEIDAHDAGLTLSDLADTVVEEILAGVGAEMQPFEAMAIAATGALGLRELDLAAPVELLFIYENDGEDTGTPIRLARRIVNYCSARTISGKICQVDATKEIWGPPGPIVTPVDALFSHFYESPSAEQLLAWAQLRVTCGTSELRARIEDAVTEVLSSPGVAKRLPMHACKAIDNLEDTDEGDAKSGLRRCSDIRTAMDMTVRTVQLNHSAANRGALIRFIPEALTDISGHGLLDAEDVRHLSEIRNRIRQVEAMLSVRFGQTSHWPDRPDSDLLRAVGMLSPEEWQAGLVEGVTLLCKIRDERLRTIADRANL
jgi:glutamate-ammonia-ligase adenylyltransferase